MVIKFLKYLLWVLLSVVAFFIFAWRAFQQLLRDYELGIV